MVFLIKKVLVVTGSLTVKRQFTTTFSNIGKIEVDEISGTFGYNKDYISRAFKRNYGVSLKMYIDNERLRYIKDLLLYIF